MVEYHVGAGLLGIYAGTLNKSKTRWQNKTECTDEVLCAVRDYLKDKADSEKRNLVGYEWTLKDGRVVRLAVEIRQPEEGEQQ